MTKREIMRWGARTLYADDPEWFRHGCADISATLEEFARRLRIPGVRAVYGRARHPQLLRSDPSVFHAWLEIDGKVYDPRGDVERIRYSARRGGVSCDVFGVMEETVDWKADVLMELWEQRR